MAVELKDWELSAKTLDSLALPFADLTTSATHGQTEDGTFQWLEIMGMFKNELKEKTTY